MRDGAVLASIISAVLIVSTAILAGVCFVVRRNRQRARYIGLRKAVSGAIVATSAAVVQATDSRTHRRM